MEILNRTKSARPPFLRWALSGAGFVILLIFVQRIEFDALLASVTGLRWPFVIQAIGFTLLNVALKVLRWQTIVHRALDVRLKWGQAIAAILAGVAGASFIPGRSFDAAKPLMLRISHGVPVSQGIPAVLAERILDLVALLLLFLATLIVGPHMSELLLGPAVPAMSLLLALMLIAFILFAGRWLRLVERWAASHFPRFRALSLLGSLKSATDLMHRSVRNGTVIFYSLAAIVAEVARAHAVLRAFGIDLPISLIAFSFAASILVGLLAFIPGGVGVTETSQAGFVALFAPHAASSFVQGAVLFDRVLSYYMLVIVGALVLMTFRVTDEGTDEPATDRTRQRFQEAAR